MLNQQQATGIGGNHDAEWPVARRGLVLGLAVALWACLVSGKALTTPFSGLVSIADGEPFTIVRRDKLLTGSRGVTLTDGDIVTTGPGALVLIESQKGNLLAIGPSTDAYVVQTADLTVLRIHKGWVKAHIKAGGVRLEGTRLGIEAPRAEAVLLLHADERSDAVFDEQGSARLVLRDEAGAHHDRETAANQFFDREERSDVRSRLGPSGEFVRTMPLAFRDPLPAHLEASPVEPRLARAVNYSDIQAWLTSARDWRGGFIARFRDRLKDPAFFAAMDAHLTLFPEWREILHPPPPPDSRSGGSRPEPKPTPPERNTEQSQEPR